MNNLTNLDVNQIQRYQYDEKANASRVKIVGIDGLKEGIIESLKGLKVEFPKEKWGQELQVQQIKVPEIIKEYQVIEIPKVITEIKVERIEVPVIIKETEIKFIDRPVILESVKIVEIEKPVYYTEYKELPKGIFLSLGLFLTLNLGLLIVLICK
jgi:hypothetical protein